MKRLVLCLAIVIAFATPGLANHHYVDWTGIADHTYLIDGILWASSGDTVFVRPGTYTGQFNRGLSFGGKNFTLISTDGPEATTIDCEGVDRALTFNGGETSAATLSGFTIANGSASSGGGIVVSGSAPTIENCRFVSCESTGYTWGGGAVACVSASAPTFRDVEFSECSGDYGGALLSSAGSVPTFENVRFLNNASIDRGGGAYIENPSGPVTFTNCVFFDNEVTDALGTGGALCLFGASPVITGTTFAMNSADSGGCITLMVSSSPTIENCILALSRDGGVLLPFGGTNTPVTTQSCVFGNADGDSLYGSHSDCSYDDPRFCGVLAGDLHLCANSPCAPAVNPWGIVVGAYDVGCANCNNPVERCSWGTIKSLFR